METLEKLASLLLSQLLTIGDFYYSWVAKIDQILRLGVRYFVLVFLPLTILENKLDWSSLTWQGLNFQHFSLIISFWVLTAWTLWGWMQNKQNCRSACEGIPVWVQSGNVIEDMPDCGLYQIRKTKRYLLKCQDYSTPEGYYIVKYASSYLWASAYFNTICFW